MRQQDVFASSQVLVFNPILKEPLSIRTYYFHYLRKLIRLVKWDRRKYTKAQIAFYKDTLCGESTGSDMNAEMYMPTRVCYLMPFDLALILGFHKKILQSKKIDIIINRIIADFNLPLETSKFLRKEIEASLGDESAWNEVLKSKATTGYKRYLKIVRENILFIKQEPYHILITATMSAGKSTLINALVGKNISRTQNMACTSKIHRIISKPFEDGVTTEYDHDLSMNASKEELLADNDENFSSKITVGTYFDSCLGGRRVVLLDSPGVNSSENVEHREISYKMIRSRKYDLLVYVINATQLATNDEAFHLEAVKKQVGRTKIVFVMNHIDRLITEDEDVLEVLENQRRFLISKGFRDPIICPVSARAAYFAKRGQHESLSRIERREMDNYIDKFCQKSMVTYYEKKMNCRSPLDATTESEILFKNCGFAYLEQIIEHLSNGGNVNGSGLC